MLETLCDPFILGPILLIILILETVFLKNHCMKYIFTYIVINMIPIIGVVVSDIYISKNIRGDVSKYSLLSMSIYKIIICIDLCLVIYFSIKIIIKLIRREKLEE